MTMQYNEMTELDLKMSLLNGKPIKSDNLKITPYILSEIVDYGYSSYMRNLQWISLEKDDFIDSMRDDDKKIFLEEQRDALKTFDFYIRLGGNEMQEALVNALSMIFRTEDVRVLNNSIVIDFLKLGIIEEVDDEVFYNEDKLDYLSESDIKIINRDNFDEIVRIVKLQNYIEKPKTEEVHDENPADEETRKLIEHMKKMREEVEKKKRQQRADENDDEDVDIADIISAVSSKSNSLNKLNIWNLTLYQLYDEYARLELIDNYDFSVKAMMAGSEKVNLTHWSSKV